MDHYALYNDKPIYKLLLVPVICGQVPFGTFLEEGSPVEGRWVKPNHKHNQFKFLFDDDK